MLDTTVARAGNYPSNLLQLVRQTVQGTQAPGTYQGLQVCVDLTTAQGRWELLVLAVLLAARVSEKVAETAFAALRQADLLDYHRVLLGNACDRQKVLDILMVEYRAVIDRRRKADAIFANARLLADYCQGDLNNVYYGQPSGLIAVGTPARRSKADAIPVVAALRRLQQIDGRALWICRTMADAGLWEKLDPAATTYCDRHVRVALTCLGLVRETGAWSVIQQETEAAVASVFAGETAGLSRLGRFYCQREDSEICRTHCLAFAHCRRWHGLPALPNQEGAGE